MECPVQRAPRLFIFVADKSDAYVRQPSKGLCCLVISIDIYTRFWSHNKDRLTCIFQDGSRGATQG